MKRNVKKSYKYGEYGSFEHLLFLLVFALQSQGEMMQALLQMVLVAVVCFECPVDHAANHFYLAVHGSPSPTPFFILFLVPDIRADGKFIYNICNFWLHWSAVRLI